MRSTYRIRVITVLSILGCVACSERPEQLIADEWSCNGKTDSAEISALVQYVGSGDYWQTFELKFQASGNDIELLGNLIGNWEIEGTELRTTVEDVNVLSVSVNGRDVQDKSRAEDIVDSWIGMTEGSRIVQLDDQVLVIENFSERMTCSRQ